MSLFKRLFGLSWQQLQAKVRYRILILTLLPILLTLVSLVFITIYWNISYTGKQLFMKVKADLTVANNTLAAVQERQEKQLEHVMQSFDFQTHFRSILEGEQLKQKELSVFLDQQRKALDLDFLRLVRIADAAADPDLRQMLPLVQGQSAYSGLMVLSSSRLARIDPELAERAKIPVKMTLRAQNPDREVEERGMLSRSLLPVADENGKVGWYLDGGILFNRNTRIVDHIRDLVYDKGTLPERSIGTVTIFLDNIRISTNVPLHFFPKEDENRGRALGTLVSEEVRQQVLVKGQLWV
ncbi:cache domain-containing protein, partial [Shewanella sp.]